MKSKIASSFLHVCIALCMLTVSTISARIEECPTLKMVTTIATEDTLIIFDIDNTIYAAAQTLGRDQWFTHQIEENKRQGHPIDFATKNAIDLWSAIQCHTEVLPIEPCAKSIIEELQKSGRTVMALTTRGDMIASRTIDQLDSLKIDMAKRSPCASDFYLKAMPDILWKRGILFTGGAHKGKAFLAFIKETEISPRRVIFINDKKSHIREMEEIFGHTDIEFIGLRYSGADKDVLLFDSEVAKIQLEHFHHFLSSSLTSDEEIFHFMSDDEAKKILAEKTADSMS